MLSDILDAIDLVPAPTHFRRLRLSEPSCALPSDCGKDARIFKCNGNPMCPSSEGRYPLGGISYVRRYREFEEVMRSVEPFDDGLSPAVRRAFPDLLHAFNMFVLKNVKLYGPETSFYDSQSDLFYCNQLHDAQADLIQRDSWGRLLVHSLDALRGDRYEGIEVEKTSNMRLWIRRQAGLHVRLGELASTNLDHGTCKVVATNGELGITTACSQPPCDGVVCDIAEWPGGKVPVLTSLDLEGWNRVTAETNALAIHVQPASKVSRGYLAHRIQAGGAPQAEIYLLSRDMEPPKCRIRARWVSDTRIEAVVESEDWEMAKVGVSVLTDRDSDFVWKEGDKATFLLDPHTSRTIGARGDSVDVLINARCVDAAGNASVASAKTVPCDFSCSSGKCLIQSEVCDGVRQCAGGEDEDEGRCIPFCRTGHWDRERRLCSGQLIVCGGGGCSDPFGCPDDWQMTSSGCVRIRK